MPRDIALPVRHIAEQTDNIVRWKTLPRDGHFAAMDQPELITADLRDALRPYRRQPAPPVMTATINNPDEVRTATLTSNTVRTRRTPGLPARSIAAYCRNGLRGFGLNCLEYRVCHPVNVLAGFQPWSRTRNRISCTTYVTFGSARWSSMSVKPTPRALPLAHVCRSLKLAVQLAVPSKGGSGLVPSTIEMAVVPVSDPLRAAIGPDKLLRSLPFLAEFDERGRWTGRSGFAAASDRALSTSGRPSNGGAS